MNSDGKQMGRAIHVVAASGDRQQPEGLQAAEPMKITFVLMRVCGRSIEGIEFSLWAYHDVTGIVREVANFRRMPYRNIVDSCVIVYERGVRSGMVLSGIDGEGVDIETEIFLDEEEAGDFILRRLREKGNVDGDEPAKCVQEDEDGL